MEQRVTTFVRAKGRKGPRSANILRLLIAKNKKIDVKLVPYLIPVPELEEAYKELLQIEKEYITKTELYTTLHSHKIPKPDLKLSRFCYYKKSNVEKILLWREEQKKEREKKKIFSLRQISFQYRVRYHELLQLVRVMEIEPAAEKDKKQDNNLYYAEQIMELYRQFLPIQIQEKEEGMVSFFKIIGDYNLGYSISYRPKYIIQKAGVKLYKCKNKIYILEEELEQAVSALEAVFGKRQICRTHMESNIAILESWNRRRAGTDWVIDLERMEFRGEKIVWGDRIQTESGLDIFFEYYKQADNVFSGSGLEKLQKRLEKARRKEEK